MPRFSEAIMTHVIEPKAVTLFNKNIEITVCIVVQPFVKLSAKILDDTLFPIICENWCSPLNEKK